MRIGTERRDRREDQGIDQGHHSLYCAGSDIGRRCLRLLRKTQQVQSGICESLLTVRLFLRLLTKRRLNVWYRFAVTQIRLGENGTQNDGCTDVEPDVQVFVFFKNHCA